MNFIFIICPLFYILAVTTASGHHQEIGSASRNPEENITEPPPDYYQALSIGGIIPEDILYGTPKVLGVTDKKAYEAGPPDDLTVVGLRVDCSKILHFAFQFSKLNSRYLA